MGEKPEKYEALRRAYTGQGSKPHTPPRPLATSETPPSLSLGHSPPRPLAASGPGPSTLPAPPPHRKTQTSTGTASSSSSSSMTGCSAGAPAGRSRFSRLGGGTQRAAPCNGMSQRASMGVCDMCMGVDMYVFVYVYVHEYVYVYVYVHVHVHVYMYVCVCVCVCVYAACRHAQAPTGLSRRACR